jgi:hypothetical protein
MRNGSSLALLVSALVMAGCASVSVSQTRTDSGADRAGAVRPVLIHHVVLFRLKDPVDASALIADCDRLIAAIPVVASYGCGRHHEVGRPNIEDDYDVALLIGFSNDEDYATYVAHPSHVELVESWRPRLRWLRVYDVLDERG